MIQFTPKHETQRVLHTKNTQTNEQKKYKKNTKKHTNKYTQAHSLPIVSMILLVFHLIFTRLKLIHLWRSFC